LRISDSDLKTEEKGKEKDIITEQRDKYAQEIFKSKREELLRSKRAPLMGKYWMKKDVKIYDISIKKDSVQRILHMNQKPMVCKNLLEISTTKHNENEEYHYYTVEKSAIDIEDNIPKLALGPEAQKVMGDLYGEDDLDDRADSDHGPKDPDDYDSNSEGNSDATYPEDEDIVARGENRGGVNTESDDELQIIGPEQEEEEEEEKPKEYYESEFTRNFASKIANKIHDMEQE